MSRRTTRRVIIAGSLALATALTLGACSKSEEASDATSSTTASTVASRQESTLVVFAAASLRNTFATLEQQFEAAHPGVDVQLNLAGSSDLVTQLQQGAPADVFASADENNMKKAVDAGLTARTPVDFASNTLTIVTAPGNPKHIESLADLGNASLVTCAPQVPCGSATKKVADAAGVTLAPVSEESNVTDVLGKVTSGQADAGLVYLTDAASAKDKVATVDFPESTDAVNIYPIAVLKESKQAELAQQWVDLVTSDSGQRVLADAGFAQP